MNYYQKFQIYLNQFLDKKYFLLKLFIFILFINIIFLLFLYPIRDSLHYHFSSFNFISSYISEFYKFPIIYPEEGGVDIGFSIMSYGILMPNKIFGYILAIFFGNSFFLYKLTFLLGLFIYTSGIYKLLLCKYSHDIASKLSLLSLLFGVGISFHQEQVIYTVMLLPWLYLYFKYYSENQGNYIVLIILAYIIGTLTHTHQPSIQFFSIILIFLLSFNFKSYLKKINIKSLFLLLLLILFFAYPTIFYLQNNGNIFFPIRYANGINEISSFDDYIKLNMSDASSLFHNISTLSEALKIITIGDFKVDDNISLLLGIPLTIVLLISFLIILFKNFFCFSKYFLIFLVLIMFATGLKFSNYHINILFDYFPLLFKNFRQWYHFFPVINFFIILLIAESMFFLSNPKLKKFFNYLLFLTVVTNISYLHYSYLFNTTIMEPPINKEFDNGVNVINNPNLINYNFRKKLCNDHIVRVEPHVFPEQIPIIFDENNLYKKKNCYSLKDKKSNYYANPYIKQKSILYSSQLTNNQSINLTSDYGLIEGYYMHNNQILFSGFATNMNYKSMEDIYVVVNNKFTCVTTPNRKIKIKDKKITAGFTCEFGIIPFEKINTLELYGKRNEQVFKYENNIKIIEDLSEINHKKLKMIDFKFTGDKYILNPGADFILSEFSININRDIIKNVYFDNEKKTI